MASRDQDKAEHAKRDILAEIPDSSLELQPLDLASLASVREAAARILAEHDGIDVLVNNAGLMGDPGAADGGRVRDAVRREPPRPLLPHGAPAAGAAEEQRRARRIRHEHRSPFRTPGRPGQPNTDGRYDPWRAYGQSKIANVHFALELDRRFREARVPAKSIVTHPGFTNTDLQARRVRETGGGRSQRFFRSAVVRFGMTPARGALSLLRAAADPSAVGGALYAPRWVNWGRRCAGRCSAVRGAAGR